jgi:hypothetical protein
VPAGSAVALGHRGCCVAVTLFCLLAGRVVVVAAGIMIVIPNEVVIIALTVALATGGWMDENGEAMGGVEENLYYSRWRSVTSIDSFKFNAARKAHSSKKIDTAVF